MSSEIVPAVGSTRRDRGDERGDRAFHVVGAATDQ